MRVGKVDTDENIKRKAELTTKALEKIACEGEDHACSLAGYCKYAEAMNIARDALGVKEDGTIDEKMKSLFPVDIMQRNIKALKSIARSTGPEISCACPTFKENPDACKHVEKAGLAKKALDELVETEPLSADDIELLAKIVLGNEKPLSGWEGPDIYDCENAALALRQFAMVKRKYEMQLQKLDCEWNSGDEIGCYIVERVRNSLGSIFGKENGEHDTIRKLAEIIAYHECGGCGKACGKDSDCVSGKTKCPILALACATGALNEIQRKKTDEDRASYPRMLCETIGKIFNEPKELIEKRIKDIEEWKNRKKPDDQPPSETDIEVYVDGVSWWLSKRMIERIKAKYSDTKDDEEIVIRKSDLFEMLDQVKRGYS